MSAHDVFFVQSREGRVRVSRFDRLATLTRRVRLASVEPPRESADLRRTRAWKWRNISHCGRCDVLGRSESEVPRFRCRYSKDPLGSDSRRTDSKQHDQVSREREAICCRGDRLGIDHRKSLHPSRNQSTTQQGDSRIRVAELAILAAAEGTPYWPG